MPARRWRCSPGRPSCWPSRSWLPRASETACMAASPRCAGARLGRDGLVGGGRRRGHRDHGGPADRRRLPAARLQVLRHAGRRGGLDPGGGRGRRRGPARSWAPSRRRGLRRGQRSFPSTERTGLQAAPVAQLELDGVLVPSRAACAGRPTWSGGCAGSPVRAALQQAARWCRRDGGGVDAGPRLPPASVTPSASRSHTSRRSPSCWPTMPR